MKKCQAKGFYWITSQVCLMVENVGEIQSQDTERGVYVIVQNSISREKTISDHAKDLFLFAREDIA